ncbi:MAG: cytochrome c biogenesis protein ResB, partial [Bacteroidales bacterium]|nr:cytochrome c biogenesis protein ResB [Bacteroidales bacterium]
MKKVLKLLSFGSMAAIILALMAASFLNDPTDVYHSWWFIALWAVAAGSGVGYLAERGVPKRFFTFCLHLSFVVILAGALVTFIWGEKGSLSLNSGETASEYLKEDGSAAALPFSLRLDEFRVEYYPGSKAPSDYCSSVTILPSGESRTISMNKILRRSGYRFYQASFDPGDGSSTLSVSHDPWGIGITYSGYLLLLLSMIGFFFERGSG